MNRLQLVLPQTAQLFLAESLFVQESPEHLRELRIPIVVLAVDFFTTLGQVVPTPTDPTTAGSGWPSSLLPESPREALARGSVEGCAGDEFF
jgi:hypothetical protein